MCHRNQTQEKLLRPGQYQGLTRKFGTLNVTAMLTSTIQSSKNKKLHAFNLIQAEKKTQTFCREANFENLKSVKTECTIQG